MHFCFVLYCSVHGGQSEGLCDRSMLDASVHEWNKELLNNLSQVDSYVPQVSCFIACSINTAGSEDIVFKSQGCS